MEGRKNMTAKEYLSQADRARKNIFMLKNQIESLNAAMESVGRASMGGSRVQSSQPKDPQGDKIARIMDKKMDCEKRLTHWHGVLADVAVMFADIECVICYEVLRLRYLEGAGDGVTALGLRERAERMKYSYSHIQKLHRAGIVSIANANIFTK